MLMRIALSLAQKTLVEVEIRNRNCAANVPDGEVAGQENRITLLIGSIY